MIVNVVCFSFLLPDSELDGDEEAADGTKDEL
jgi:hypothetical protein